MTACGADALQLSLYLLSFSSNMAATHPSLCFGKQYMEQQRSHQVS